MRSFKNRRGAIAVLMVVLLGGLMLTAAAAVDVSRMFSIQNELKTAAEAAALAGGRQLLEDPTLAADSAKAVGDSNFVLNQRVNVDAGEDIRFGIWDPDARAWAPQGTPTGANAIRVTTRAPSNYLIAQVFGLAPIQLRAEATVWAEAPVGETNCVKPWAVPYQWLTVMLDPANPNMVRDLTPGDLAQLQSLPSTSLGAVIKIGPQAPPAVQGNSYSVQIGTGPQNTVYASNINPPCEDLTVSPLDKLPLVTSDPLDVALETVNGTASWCAQFGARPCVAKVVLWSDVDDGTVQVRMMGGFVITDWAQIPPDSAEVRGYFTILPDNGGIYSKLTPLRRPILVR